MKTVHKTLMLAAALALGTPALAAGPCEVEIESNDAMQFNQQGHAGRAGELQAVQGGA